MNVELLQWLNGFAGKSPIFDVIILFFAEYIIYILFTGAALWIIANMYMRRHRSIVLFFAVLIVSFLALQLLGLLSDLPRPFMDHSLTVLLPGAGGEAFPSDHTAASGAIAFAFLLVLRDKIIGIMLIILACAIGIARIVSGVHYPVDVAGGMLAGLIGIMAVWIAVRVAYRYQSSHS